RAVPARRRRMGRPARRTAIPRVPRSAWPKRAPLCGARGAPRAPGCARRRSPPAHQPRPLGGVADLPAERRELVALGVGRGEVPRRAGLLALAQELLGLRRRALIVL